MRARLSLLPEIGILAGMFMLIVACRLTIDTPNFQPVMAVALLGGMLVRPFWLAMTVVIGAMAVSDLFQGFYDWRLAMSVYACLALPALAGPLLRRYSRQSIVFTGIAAGTSVISAIIFYLGTNFAFWYFTDYYSPDSRGLMAALAMGLPFFKWSVLSNTLFTLAITAVYQFVTSRSRRLAAQAVRVPVE